MADPTEVLRRPAPPPDVTLRYGDGPDHVIDLRLPPGPRARRPLVVVVHGGFWRARYDRTHTGPQASALAALGYVVAVPEYRRVGQPGGGWPGTFDDTASWSDRLVGLVTAEIGEEAVDPASVVLVGHSAGGQLSLWAASRHRLAAGSAWRRATPLAVRGVVSLAGVCDLALAAGLRLGDGAVQDLLGGDPEAVPDRYPLADPAALLPSGVRSVLVHGADDVNVPIALSRAYADRALRVGDDVRVVDLPGTAHFEVIDPLSAAWPAVTAAVREILA
jgi:acetyl esterase/lipase